MSNDKRETMAMHRENAKRNLIDALGWVSSSDVQELSRGGVGDDGGFVLMGPGVYYFLGGTMSGK